jgi:hypothetical protein
MAGRSGGDEPERLALRTEAESEAGPKGDGLRERIGLAPRDEPPANRDDAMDGAAGARMATSASSASADVSSAAALSRTEGTDCSRASVPFARGIRCGFAGGGWMGGEAGSVEGVRESERMGSTSRSKIAEDDECLSHPSASET